MKTANNRQQYPGFACLPSDNNFNLPTEYIQFQLSVCYCMTALLSMSTTVTIKYVASITMNEPKKEKKSQ